MVLPEDHPRPTLLEGDGLFPVAVTGHRRLGPYGPPECYNPRSKVSVEVMGTPHATGRPTV